MDLSLDIQGESQLRPDKADVIWRDAGLLNMCTTNQGVDDRWITSGFRFMSQIHRLTTTN